MPEHKAKKRVIKKITLQTREEIQKLTLRNNAVMNLALEDNIPCVEEMLRIILSKPDLVVKTARTQKMFQDENSRKCSLHRSVDGILRTVERICAR